jgi:hypothetical protein
MNNKGKINNNVNAKYKPKYSSILDRFIISSDKYCLSQIPASIRMVGILYSPFSLHLKLKYLLMHLFKDFKDS